MKKKNNKAFWKRLVAILICLFCSISCVGCVGTVGGSSGGSGSGGSSSSGGSGGSSSGGSSSGGISDTGDFTTDENGNFVYVDKSAAITDLTMGGICVYDVGGTEAVFYDNYKGAKVNFNTLVDRQFNTLATYIYKSLVKIYGTTEIQNKFDIAGYNGASGTSSAAYEDVLSTAQIEAIALQKAEYATAPYNQFYFANAMKGDTVLSIADDGSDVTYEYTEYDSDPLVMPWYDGVTLNTWKVDLEDSFNISNIAKDLKFIYQNMPNVTINASSEITLNNATLKAAYSGKTAGALGTVSNDAITHIGIEKKFEWCMAYYIAYTLIGDTAIQSSLDAMPVVMDINTSTFKDFVTEYNNTTTDDEKNALVNAFNNYKAYDVVIKEIVESAVSAIVSGGNILTSNSSNYPHVGGGTSGALLNYYNGNNWSVTLYPRLERKSYVFLDNLSNVCDAIENENDENGDTVINGDAKKLLQIVVLPYINTNKYKKPTFQLGGIVGGFESSEDVLLDLRYTAVFNGGAKIDNSRVYLEEEEYDDESSSKKPSVIVDNKIDLYRTFTYSNEAVDIEFFEANSNGEVDIPEQYSFGNIKFAGYDVGKEKDFINATFAASEDYTVATNNKKYKVRYLNTYNPLITIDGLALESNYMILDFNYYNRSGGAISSTPSIYVQIFDVYDN